MVNHSYWNEAHERAVTMRREELEAMWVEKLRWQLQYDYDNSPMYRQKFEDAGVKPQDIRTWNDFRHLKIYVSKEDDRKGAMESVEKYGHPYGMYVCAPMDKIIRINATTGTTGDPVFYGFSTRKGIQTSREMCARLYWHCGIRPGDTVLHALGISSMVHAGVPFIDGLEYFGAQVVAVGAEAGTDRILRAINRTRPKALLCTPALAEYLIEKSPEILGKEVGKLGIKIIISVAAPGAGVPEIRQKIEGAYGCRLYNSYSGPVWGLENVSCDCDEYHHLHVLSPDYCIGPQDLVDPDTKEPLEIKDGVIGEPLFTVLDCEATPPLKYTLGDIIQVFTEECPGCGFQGMRFEVLGRIDDMIIVLGVNVYPLAVKGIVESFVPRTTGEMRVVIQESGVAQKPPIPVKVEHAAGMSEEDKGRLAKELEEALHARLKFRARVELLPPGTLERAAGPGAIWKGKLIEKAY